MTPRAGKNAVLMVLSGIPEELFETLSSWLLFKRPRMKLPPMKVAAPSIVIHRLNLHEAAESLDILPHLTRFTKPWLFLTESSGAGWRIGSGWALTDGDLQLGPSKQGNDLFYPLQTHPRTRFAIWEANGRANLLITIQESDDTLLCSQSVEVDGLMSQHTYGSIERRSNKVAVSSQQISYKCCPFCSTRQKVCSCAPSMTRGFFHRQLMTRQQVCRQSVSMVGAAQNYYTHAWLSGCWSFRVNGKVAASVNLTFNFSPHSLRNSLTCVLQSEMEQLLQPQTPLSSRQNSHPYPTTSSGTRNHRSPVQRLTSDHVKSNPPEQHRCSKCSATFTRQYDLQRHLRSVHQFLLAYQCEWCPQSFPSYYHLRDHLRTEHPDSPDVVCTVCGKNFRIKSKLKRHIKAVHENVRDFVCLHCGKCYKDKQALFRHMRGKHKLYESQSKRHDPS